MFASRATTAAIRAGAKVDKHFMDLTFCTLGDFWRPSKHQKELDLEAVTKTFKSDFWPWGKYDVTQCKS
ncbi:hypothetical protein EJB05_04544, partial [Eragrostis curvula]